MRRRALLSQDSLDRLALRFEIDLFEAVLRGDPGHLASLEALANAYVRAGRAAEALEVDRRLCALLPENPVAHYNLACTLSLAGEVDRALESLARAIALGYRDFKYIARDPDLENVRRDVRFRDLIKA